MGTEETETISAYNYSFHSHERMECCGVGEVRRANIVYFLSREGKVEHPHLISVHHFHSNPGVQLRDVKRWLSEQRGKDMPDSFAWSYKRRYRTGYVWQDLKDDDLITPISDNEYVLKGSRIPSSPSTVTNSEGWSSGEKTRGRGDVEMEPEAKKPAEILEIEPEDTVSPKPPPRLDLDSPDPERCSDETAERTAVFKMDLPSQRVVERKWEDKRESWGRSSASRRASQVLRSILTCRLVATNESALLPIGRRERDLLAGGGGGGGGGGPLLPLHQNTNANANGYSKIKSTSGGKSSTVAGEKAGPAVCKPAAAPNCSQCGKAFRPEKLHSHMKSCKALKG